ncbi:tripartite tricarboxylate transporter TctB family protein [Pseudochelatococcus sp. B33]
MNNLDYKSVLGGLVMLAFGLLLAIYPAYHYSLGTLREMGPGLFPVLVGWLLSGVSCVIILTGLFTPGDRIDIVYRPLIVIAASVLLFALAVPYFGMLPAVVLAAIASTYAEKRSGWLEPLAIALAMAIFSIVVFHYGLKINIPLFSWAL